MNDREFFCQRHQTELPAFQRVLAALPLNQFEYRPHERSPSTLDLVWTLANEMAACSTIIDRGEVHWADVPAPRPTIRQRPRNGRQLRPTHLGPFPCVERAVVTDHHDSGARGSARGALKLKSMEWFASHKKLLRRFKFALEEKSQTT